MIDHEQIAVCVYRDAGRPVQFARAAAECAPAGQRIAGGVEAHDAVEVFAGHIGIAPLVARNRGGPNELPIVVAVFPECAVVFAVYIVYGDAKPAVIAVKRAAHGVKLALCVKSSVHRVIEAAPFHRGKPDGVAVLQDFCALHCCCHRYTSGELAHYAAVRGPGGMLCRPTLPVQSRQTSARQADPDHEPIADLRPLEFVRRAHHLQHLRDALLGRFVEVVDVHLQIAAARRKVFERLPRIIGHRHHAHSVQASVN